MDKAFDHTKVEKTLSDKWIAAIKETSKGKPYTILMPPPNANASLHAGHAMYTVDDIIIRWKRMQGFDAQWIPGADHAGFETQFVYEKHLAKEGKSRLDFDRETLYKNVYQFVEDNSGLIFEQMKRLGFSASWDKSVFTLDPHVVSRVFETFKKMHDEKLVYRDSYIVNYCVHCGTSLAELEVKHVERIDPLYYVKYPLADEEGYVVVATVRPEPIFVDTHLAVNPTDSKNKHLIGKTVRNPLTDAVMEIIGDEYVDPTFGTGVVKLTPAHDANDFEVARKHNLPIETAIDWTGRITQNGGKYAGMKIKAAREEVVKDLTDKGLIEKVDANYMHSVITCYKCGRDLEPLTIPNWFIKVAQLKKPVIQAVEEDKVVFHPKRFKRHMLQWLSVMHDWPISRQIVWGIRIPVWYEVDPSASNIFVWWLDADKKLQQGTVSQFLRKGIELDEIKRGLQKVQALTGSNTPHYVISATEPTGMYLPETDTFDTWFSSGQWPLVTLKDEFNDRYPTDFMGTYSDILKFWVSRMIMFGLYLTNEIPFKDVYLWSMVADSKGLKMSKSKGNVINPIDLVDKYGADALRMSLMYGIPAGSKVILSEDKVRGMRNFSNKIWNATRFVQMLQKGEATIGTSNENYAEAFENRMVEIVEETTKNLEKYKLDKAMEGLYETFWHWYCDWAIEECKAGSIPVPQMVQGLKTFLTLLHPFAPFVTEACYQEMFGDSLLMLQPWPQR